MIGNDSIAWLLRKLTAKELLENKSYYANHPIIGPDNNMFVQSLTDIGLDAFTETKNKEYAIEIEAGHIQNNLTWSSFICILAVSNVINVSKFLFSLKYVQKIAVFNLIGRNASL